MEIVPECTVYYYITPSPGLLTPARQKAIALQMLHDAFPAFFGIPLQEGLIKRSAHGKPYYSGANDCFFNITHCVTAVAVAVARFPVGIDVEAPRPVKYRTAKKCCSPKELQYIFAGSGVAFAQTLELSEEEARRFLDVWTLKESYVKMTGNGMGTPFQSVCFDLPAFRQTENSALKWTKDKNCQFCLYTPGNSTIALSLQQAADSPAPRIVWKPYVSRQV